MQIKLYGGLWTSGIWYIGELTVQTLKQQAISHHLQNIVKVMAKGGKHNFDIVNSA